VTLGVAVAADQDALVQLGLELFEWLVTMAADLEVLVSRLDVVKVERRHTAAVPAVHASPSEVFD
jgi:hypothetical protein